GASSIFGSPGMKATTSPAMTSRIVGETLNRFAATATMASTATISRTVSAPSMCIGCMRSARLDGPGDHVESQRQDREIEEKRRDAMQIDAAADPLAGDGDVRHLRRHRDHEREVEKIPVVGALVAGKLQAANALVAALAVIFVRVMQREDRVHEQP